MAENSNQNKKKPRVVKRAIKPTTSVREKATSAKITTKKRPVRRVLSIVWTPFRFVGRLIAKVLSPFSFVLKPFKTKPMRKIGRILSKILLINYFRESWRELKLVAWPNKKETIKLTFAVIVFALIFGFAIAIVDYGLDKIFRRLLIG